MAKPIDLETILSEFSEESSAWVLQDQDSLQYLIIPDLRYPSRKPVRFFSEARGRGSCANGGP